MTIDLSAKLARIKELRTSIAKDRDELRQIIDELEGLAESADRGIESLDAAIDAFSEHV